MKNVLVLCAALGITCAVAGFILFRANELTYDARRQARLAQQFTAMRAVFPECEFSEATTPVEIRSGNDLFLFYPARKEGVLQGLAAFGKSDQGYGGTIRVLVGIEVESGAVRKVAVVEHGETPGLGTRVTDRQEQRKLWDLWRPPSPEPAGREGDKTDESGPALPANQYLDQFDQRKLPEPGRFKVVTSRDAVDDRQRDVVAVSGATVSSQAVADAVSRTLAVYQERKEQIMTGLEEQELSL